MNMKRLIILYNYFFSFFDTDLVLDLAFDTLVLTVKGLAAGLFAEVAGALGLRLTCAAGLVEVEETVLVERDAAGCCLFVDTDLFVDEMVSCLMVLVFETSLGLDICLFSADATPFSSLLTVEGLVLVSGKTEAVEVVAEESATGCCVCVCSFDSGEASDSNL